MMKSLVGHVVIGSSLAELTFKQTHSFVNTMTTSRISTYIRNGLFSFKKLHHNHSTVTLVQLKPRVKKPANKHKTYFLHNRRQND